MLAPMPVDLAHLLIWWSLLGLGPAVLVARLAGLRAARILLGGMAPVTLAGLWVHAVVCNPPNNWATLAKVGFFGFWFKPHQPHVYAELAGWMVALAAVGGLLALALALATRREVSRDPSTPGRAGVAYVLLVLGALFLRHVPDHLMDVRLHASCTYRDVAALVRIVVKQAAFAVVIAAVLISIGLRASRRPR
jgi:hypothetical protein